MSRTDPRAERRSAAEPKYKADVPESLLTPNTVETELLGTLDFFDGMPSDETVRKAIDFLDTSRAAEAFLKVPSGATVAARDPLPIPHSSRFGDDSMQPFTDSGVVLGIGGRHRRNVVGRRGHRCCHIVEDR